MKHSEVIATEQKQPEKIKISEIPSAVEALESLRDINLSVIYAQLEVGNTLAKRYGVDASTFYITPDWWDQHVRHSGTFQEMAQLFDSAYRTFVADQIAEITGSEVAIGDEPTDAAFGETRESDQSYEMTRRLGVALAEVEENAKAFAETVGFTANEADAEAF